MVQPVRTIEQSDGHTTYVGKERPEKAACASAQSSAEVVQDDLRDVRGGAAVSRDLCTGLEAAQLESKNRHVIHVKVTE